MASISGPRATRDGDKWDVRWVGLDGKGRSQTEDTEAQARAVKVQVERELRQERADAKRMGVPVRAATMTFREVGDDLLSTITKATTKRRYEGHLRVHIYPHLGDLTFPITEARVVKTIKSWTSLADSTKVPVYVTMSAVFTWAEGMKLITKENNPCNSQLVKKNKPTEPDAQLPDAWPRQWVAAVKREIRPDLRPAAYLAAHLGLRQGEVFGASDEDFIVKADGKRYFRVRRLVTDCPQHFAPPKHRRESDDPREIPVPDFLWAFLQEHWKTYPPQPVTLPWDGGDGKPKEMRTYKLILTTRQGGAWSKSYFNKQWKTLLRSLDIPCEAGTNNGLHALRHWFACDALAKRAGLARVGTWLGHKTESFTLKAYRRFDVQGTEDVMDLMDADWREAS